MFLGIAGFFAVNLIYQVVRKPGELFAPDQWPSTKVPRLSGRVTERFFEEHSTSIISPELLAALAQVESDGNPVARTYWRWQWSWNPFAKSIARRRVRSACFNSPTELSSTARKYCIRDHAVVADGPLARSQFLLVQCLLHSNAAEPCGRNDRRVSAPERGRVFWLLVARSKPAERKSKDWLP